MAEWHDWMIVPRDNTTTNIHPDMAHTYDLLNLTCFQCLKYGEREYGINLVWADVDLSQGNVRFERLGGGSEPLKYGDRVAIHVRRNGGGYLRYAEREYGINLKWSDEPVFDWRLRAETPAPNALVDVTKPVALYNVTTSDYLFYDPRRYGINLKWFRDKGKHNSVPWYSSLGTAIQGIFDQIASLIYEFINRVVGVVDFILIFLGIMLPKKVRIRFVILRDSSGNPLISPSDMTKVNDALTFIKECFKEQLNTTVLAADSKMVEILQFPAPQSALHVRCCIGAYSEDLRQAGEYFRGNQAMNDTGPLGYGAPITIFVVDDIEGKVGCSLGPLTDYVTVDLQGMHLRGKPSDPLPTTPAHELGHACGLWHPWPKSLHIANLMKSDSPRQLTLELYQRAIARNSRHITFF